MQHGSDGNSEGGDRVPEPLQHLPGRRHLRHALLPGRLRRQEGRPDQAGPSLPQLLVQGSLTIAGVRQHPQRLLRQTLDRASRLPDRPVDRDPQHRPDGRFQVRRPGGHPGERLPRGLELLRRGRNVRDLGGGHPAVRVVEYPSQVISPLAGLWQQFPRPLRQSQGGDPARPPLLRGGGEDVPDDIFGTLDRWLALGTLRRGGRHLRRHRRGVRARACPQFRPVADDVQGTQRIGRARNPDAVFKRRSRGIRLSVWALIRDRRGEPPRDLPHAVESFPGLVRGGGHGRHSALEVLGCGPDQVRLVACETPLGRLDVRHGGQLRRARLPPAGRVQP